MALRPPLAMSLDDRTVLVPGNMYSKAIETLQITRHGEKLPIATENDPLDAIGMPIQCLDWPPTLDVP